MPLTRPALVVLLIALFLSAPVAAAEKQPLVLQAAQSQMQAILNSLDDRMKEACGQLSAAELDSSQTARVLRWLRTKEPQVIVASTVSPQGVMVRVEPAEYSRFEGSDISQQPQVQSMLSKHQPVASRLFQTVEGYWAVDIERPIWGPKQDFRGALSATIHPAPLAKQVLDGITAAQGLRFYLLQQDGTVLFSNRLEEIGLNLKKTGLYKELPEVRQAVDRILAEPQGSLDGRHFLGEQPEDALPRRNHWTSLELHGAQWRLGFAEPIL